MDAFLFVEYLDKPLWMWLGFLGVIFALLAIDLGLFCRKDEVIGVKKSLELSAFYIIIGLAFGLWIWFELGQQSALEYYTGFVIEKSLSLDNLFVMAVIFSALQIPREYQHRVLFWGVLGVVILRGCMIGFGAALVHHFEWVLYIFAAFLIYTGIKIMVWEEDENASHEKIVENNPVLKFLQKHFRITEGLHKQHFFVRQPCETHPNRNVLYATPLLLALISIELADVVFAVDSVPAIFAITTDTYVVFTSNIFAILGLRALFFALAALIDRFSYLKYSIAAVLIFIGFKVFVPLFTSLEKVPAEVSLSVTIALLAIGIFYSLYKTKDQKK